MSILMKPWWKTLQESWLRIKKSSKTRQRSLKIRIFQGSWYPLGSLKTTFIKIESDILFVKDSCKDLWKVLQDFGKFFQRSLKIVIRNSQWTRKHILITWLITIETWQSFTRRWAKLGFEIHAGESIILLIESNKNLILTSHFPVALAVPIRLTRLSMS